MNSIKSPSKGDKSSIKKSSIFIIILIVFFLACSVVIVYLSKPSIYNQSFFIELDTLSSPAIDNYYEVIHSEEQFNSLSFSSDQYDLDFNKYKYILIQINYSICGETDIQPTKYTIDQDEVSIDIEYTIVCDNRCYLMGIMKPSYKYYLLPIPKKKKFTNVVINYQARNEDECGYSYIDKPMIYLYPENQMNVLVQLGHPELLKISYPPYQDGWKVTANPDGTLQINNREYYGLFWEGTEHPGIVHKEGFVIKGEDTISFLEKQLKTLGLNDKEANEFIVYWYPILKENSYNYIYFETKEEIDEYMPLNIQPTPDTLIRIQMDYKPLQKPITVSEQVFETPQRNGFTVIEWGGSIIKD